MGALVKTRMWKNLSQPSFQGEWVVNAGGMVDQKRPFFTMPLTALALPRTESLPSWTLKQAGLQSGCIAVR